MLIQDAPVAITENLWMLGTAEYPLYLFQGERESAIFEGGTGSMGPLLGEQMEQLGIGKESVKQLVITHAHPDHVMAVPLCREMFPGITVLASQIAAKTLSSERAISFFRQVDDALVFFSLVEPRTSSWRVTQVRFAVKLTLSSFCSCG